MGEPTGDERDLILATLLPAYNQLHGTAYQFAGDAPSGTDADWICQDPARPKEPLKLQHVRAWALEEEEIVHPKLVEQYVVRRLVSLARESNARGFHISIHVDRLPKNSRDREYLVAHDLWDTILYGAKRWRLGPTSERLLWFNRADIKHRYESLAPYISDLEIIGTSADDPTLIAWSPDHGKLTGVPHGSYRAVEALQKKRKRYGSTSGDVVLVIDFTVMPYNEQIDLPEILEWIKDEKIEFKEVWITNGLWRNQLAHQLWPTARGVE